ncbi:MAG: PadR family transcriptional regulator [Acidobacteria bacterium]|nr:PadR family transcriptional regulator [Acidobacteriota bacterium]
MSLDHAILGFLKDRPRTGYDLKTAFDLTVRHFWPADQSQIYRTLTRLVQKEWAETEVIKQDRRLDQKIYHITPKGNEELLRWLSTPLSPKALRLPKLIQIFFAANLSNDEALQCFERFVYYHRRSIAELRALPEKTLPYRKKLPPLPARDLFFRTLPWEYGIRFAETSLQWGEDVIARLKRGDHLKGVKSENTRDQRKPSRRTGQHAGSGQRIPGGSKRGRRRS